MGNRCVGRGSRAQWGKQPDKQVKELYKTAQLSLKLGDSKRAIKILRNCVSLDPSDSHSWLLLGRTLGRHGDPEAARQAFGEGSKACPDSVHILQGWAVMEKNQGRLEVARTLFEKALGMDPNNAYICHAWGLMELRDDPPNLDIARGLFKRAFAAKPQAQMCTALAGLEAGQCRLEEARAWFRKGLSLCKEKTPIRLAWAEMESSSVVIGGSSKAEALLEKALKEDSMNGRVYIARAKLQLLKGEVENARQTLKEAANLPEKLPQVFNMWATLEQKEGRLEEAGDIIMRGRESLKTGERQSLLQTQGMIAEKLGKLDEARDLYQQSIAIRPTAPAYVAWALLEGKISASATRIGRTTSKPNTKARDLFEKGLRIDTRHGPLYHAYGAMEERGGNIHAAREVFKRGIAARCSDMASVWHGLGILELRQGGAAAARDVFLKGVDALVACGEDASFLFHSLGMLEIHGRHLPSARKYFAKGLHHYPRNSQLLLGAALTEVQIGELGKGREFFQASVNADKYHAHAWQAWGVMEQREGRFVVARALFKAGIREVPRHAALWVAYGLMEAKLGNITKARELFKTGVATCGHERLSLVQGRGRRAMVRLLHASACAEVTAGDLNAAKQMVMHALKLNHQDGSCWTTLGIIEQRCAVAVDTKQHDLSIARRVYELGLRACPNHGPLYASYGLMESRGRKFTKARKIWQRGLQFTNHAPLYHYLAEVEALYGNFGALAGLHVKAKQLFEADFSKPPPPGTKPIGSIEGYFDMDIYGFDTEFLQTGVSVLGGNLHLAEEERK